MNNTARTGNFHSAILALIACSLLTPSCKSRHNSAKTKSAVSFDGQTIELDRYIANLKDYEGMRRELDAIDEKLYPKALHLLRHKSIDIKNDFLLEDEERVSIRIWTEGDSQAINPVYSRINSALRSPDVADDKNVAHLVRVLSSAINKLNGQPCDAIRTVKSLPESVLKLRPGERFKDSGFAAFNQGNTPAESFEGNPIWILASSPICNDISRFSKFEHHEKETLFPPGSDFEVVRNDIDTSVSPAKGKIVLKHLPPRAPETNDDSAYPAHMNTKEPFVVVKCTQVNGIYGWHSNEFGINEGFFPSHDAEIQWITPPWNHKDTFTMSNPLCRRMLRHANLSERVLCAPVKSVPLEDTPWDKGFLYAPFSVDQKVDGIHSVSYGEPQLIASDCFELVKSAKNGHLCAPQRESDGKLKYYIFKTTENPENFTPPRGSGYASLSECVSKLPAEPTPTVPNTPSPPETSQQVNLESLAGTFKDASGRILEVNSDGRCISRGLQVVRHGSCKIENGNGETLRLVVDFDNSSTNYYYGILGPKKICFTGENTTSTECAGAMHRVE